jgi:hypothetical protein
VKNLAKKPAEKKKDAPGVDQRVGLTANDE